MSRSREKLVTDGRTDERTDGRTRVNLKDYLKVGPKNNDEISRKCQKTGFSGIFPAFSAGKNFFPKIGLRHILGIVILHLCAKNQEKLMNHYREKLVTEKRTNGQQLIYRTSREGPKIYLPFNILPS